MHSLTCGNAAVAQHYQSVTGDISISFPGVT